MSTWAASRRVDLADLAPLDLGNVDDPDVEVEGEWRVSVAAERAVAKAELLIALGGDNSLTAPLGVGALGDLSKAGVITFDAHHDIREGRSNGSPIRRLLEAGLSAEHVVQIGLADWANSRSYADEAHARGVHFIHRGDVADRGVEACFREAMDIAATAGGPVLVDLDLDVCDRAVAPACPASLPGGLSARDVMTAAYLAGADRRVRAIDVTEVDAHSDTADRRTIRLAALCLLEAAAGLAKRLNRDAADLRT